MTHTHHIDRRMNQRGITNEMIDYVLANGVSYKDKLVLTQRECDRRIRAAKAEIVILIRKRDANGYVFADHCGFVTTADRLIDGLRNELRILVKIRDKGGLTVIEEDDALITTYRANSFSRSAQRRRSHKGMH